MSFPDQYNQFQSPGPQEGVPGQMPPPQDGGAPGQAHENNGGGIQFSHQENNGGAQPGGVGGDQKTTLWYLNLANEDEPN